MTAPDALEFLAKKVEEQAELDEVPLSAVEAKMMRWSKVEPGAINDVAVSEEFNRDYEEEEYEHKISQLLGHAYKRGKKQGSAEAQLWEDAKNALKGHDYYLLAMAEDVFGEVFSPARQRTVTLIRVIVIATVILIIVLWFTRHSRGV